MAVVCYHYKGVSTVLTAIALDYELAFCYYLGHFSCVKLYLFPYSFIWVLVVL